MARTVLLLLGLAAASPACTPVYALHVRNGAKADRSLRFVQVSSEEAPAPPLPDPATGGFRLSGELLLAPGESANLEFPVEPYVRWVLLDPETGETIDSGVRDLRGFRGRDFPIER